MRDGTRVSKKAGGVNRAALIIRGEDGSISLKAGDGVGKNAKIYG
jgi:hypothetical protein